MTDKTCYFCEAAAPTTHGIHGCEHFDLCSSCRTKFMTIRFFADPLQQQLLGFECSNCGFTCDVPGRVEYNPQTQEFDKKVDSKHNYCQNCGTPSKPDK